MEGLSNIQRALDGAMDTGFSTQPSDAMRSIYIRSSNEPKDAMDYNAAVASEF